MFAKKEEGGERNRGHIQKGSSLQLVKCKNQKSTVTLHYMMARLRRCCSMAQQLQTQSWKPSKALTSISHSARCMEAQSTPARSVPEQGFDVHVCIYDTDVSIYIYICMYVSHLVRITVERRKRSSEISLLILGTCMCVEDAYLCIYRNIWLHKAANIAEVNQLQL